MEGEQSNERNCESNEQIYGIGIIPGQSLTFARLLLLSVTGVFGLQLILQVMIGMSWIMKYAKQGGVETCKKTTLLNLPYTHWIG
jgi:hypothetical protein